MREHARRTTVLAAVSGVVIALVAVGSGTAHRGGGERERGIDLTATALPTGARPDVRDRAFKVRWSHVGVVQVDTTATGSANCDDCTAEAQALQVLYLHEPRASELNNVATAWTPECKNCRSRALSVQVAIVEGGPEVVANNRSVAANVACVNCATAAAAYQLVVVGAHDRLTDEEMGELRAWVKSQRRALRAATDTRPEAGARARRPATSVRAIEELVTGAVRGRAVVAEADVDDGR